MRCITVFLFILLTGPVYCGGFEEMITCYQSLPGTFKNEYSHEPLSLCEKGMTGEFLHANPYKIQGMGWNFAGISFGRGAWAGYGEIKLYNLEELYSLTTLTGGAAMRLSHAIAGALSVEYARESFGGYGNYDGLALNTQVSFQQGNFGASAALSKLTVARRYEAKNDQPEPMLFLAYRGDGVLLAAGLMKSSQQGGRFFASQEIRIAKSIGLRLGYMNNPNVLRWGLDFSLKMVRLTMTYIGVDRLNDTIVPGISAGSR